MAGSVKDVISKVISNKNKEGANPPSPETTVTEKPKEILKADLEPDIRKTFDKMQGKIDQPECFGKHGKDDIDVCSVCWYHPDCKLNTKKKK